MKKINVAIVDDHPMVLMGLEAILKPYRHIKVMATYPTAAALLSGLQQQQPDVLLLDISLPDQSGKDLLPGIIKDYPEMQVLILTSLDTPAMVNSMMRKGSRGYLLKGANASVLVEAVETVCRKEEYLDPALKEVLFKNLSNYKNQQQDHSILPQLSQREKEILSLIAKEYSTKEIAEKLFIGLRTAENHRYNLLQKLDVKNTAGLVKLAIQMGLME